MTKDRRPSHRYNEKELEYIRKAYEEAIPVSIIAKNLDRTPLSVSQAARKKGWKHGSFWTIKDTDLLKTMTEQGFLDSEIAKILKRTTMAIKERRSMESFLKFYKESKRKSL
jgi:hypothetical protein